MSPDFPHEEISRESNKWNFKYYGNEMLQLYGWQWAIFTSLSKLRIYSDLIYAMSSYEFNLKKCEGVEFSCFVFIRENLLNLKTSHGRNWLLWSERDHGPMGTPRWGVRTLFYFAPNKMYSNRSSATIVGMMQPPFTRNNFLFKIYPHWEGISFCLLTANSVTWELGQNEKITHNS